MNLNNAARPHNDVNNQGLSYILAVGDYSSGELWIESQGGPEEYQITSADKVPGYRLHQKVPGVSVDTRNKFLQFDGRLLHFVRPFVGNRMSIIWFTSKGFGAATSETKDKLQELGFPTPDAQQDEADVDPISAKAAKPAMILVEQAAG